MDAIIHPEKLAVIATPATSKPEVEKLARPAKPPRQGSGIAVASEIVKLTVSISKTGEGALCRSVTAPTS